MCDVDNGIVRNVFVTLLVKIFVYLLFVSMCFSFPHYTSEWNVNIS